jgi:dihydrofolate reductase
MSLPIVLVAAVSENGVIGRAGGLPWHISSDLKQFKADTMGRPIVMGRKTWESIGRPLPGRINIVVTRDKAFEAGGAVVAHTVSDAIAIAEERAGELDPGDAICIIGGGELYNRTMASADRLILTRVAGHFDGDTWFPEINPAEWKLVQEEPIVRGEKDSHPTHYMVYERVRPAVR